MVRPPRFFPWVIIGVVVVGLALVYGIRHSFSVFFPSILGEFGWSRGSTALMLSLNLLIYGFLSPVAGSLGDRWKPRVVMITGVVILGLATAGCAFASELWHFYLLFGVVMPIGTAFCGFPLLGPMLANWFVKRRGLILGLGQIGGGLSFVYALLAETVISQLGWRYAYLILAGILAALLLPLYFLFAHYRPEHKGMRAYGAAETSSNSGELPVSSSPSSDWTLGSAMRTYRLWLLVVSYFLFWGMGGYLVLAHQVKFAVDVGYSSTFAASIFALFGVFTVAGLLSASLSDWIGREKTVTLSTVLAIGALLALTFTRDTSQPWLLYVYATSFGYGVGLFWPTIQAGTADLFYGRHFGAIVGLLQVGTGVGGVIGPWLGGYLYDITGSYTSAFILCMVCYGLACIAYWIAAPRHAAKLSK